MLSDTIHERMKGWFARILLALIIVSFALFGVDAYFKGGGGQSIAKIDGQKVSALEFDDLFKQAQGRLRESGERDPEKLEGKALKQQVLDQMIRERVLVQSALARGYGISDEAIIPVVTGNPNFQENGKFSEGLFDRFLRQQRMSRGQFFQRLKQEVLINTMMGVPLASTFTPKSTTGLLAGLMAEQREISRASIPVEPFLAQVQLDETAVEAYYKAHPEISRVAERARVEYLVFSPEALVEGIELSEAEHKAYYEQHLAQFSTPEQRELAHILIRVGPDASAADRQAAQTKAAELAKKAQAEPKQFGELAKQASQDPVTAGKGGDLGFITAGSIFPAVEKAAFEMKAGDVRGPVQSPAGFHIVQVKSIKAGSQRAYAEVKELVKEGARRDAAMRRFNEEAEKFGDLVYAQFSSLKPAAEQYKLTVHVSDWMTRGSAKGVLQNDRLIQALFSEEATGQGRNTEAIEVAPNTLVAARIAEYKPAGQKPLAEVRSEIEKILRLEQATKLAAQRGENALAALRQGQTVAGITFGAVTRVDRQNPQGLSEQEMRQVFGVSGQKLPAYVGVTGPASYAILRVGKVESSTERQVEMAQMAPVLLQRSYAGLLGEVYVDSLKRQASIEVNGELLEKSER